MCHEVRGGLQVGLLGRRLDQVDNALPESGSRHQIFDPVSHIRALRYRVATITRDNDIDRDFAEQIARAPTVGIYGGNHWNLQFPARLHLSGTVGAVYLVRQPGEPVRDPGRRVSIGADGLRVEPSEGVRFGIENDAHGSILELRRSRLVRPTFLKPALAGPDPSQPCQGSRDFSETESRTIPGWTWLSFASEPR